MASKIDNLLSAFEKVVNEPWAGILSGQERVWFIVYDPTEQRKVDLRMGDFETAANKAGKRWCNISVKTCFPSWIAEHDYREEYFADPEALVDQYEADFKKYVVHYILQQIDSFKSDDHSLIVIRDVSALFGFVRLSDVLNAVAVSFKGRMLIFFPGEYYKNHYRLLDARDGWSYLARPIIV